MIKENQEIFKKVNLFFDALLLLGVFHVTYWMRAQMLPRWLPLDNLLPYREYTWILILLLPCGLFFLDTNGLYYTYRSLRIRSIPWRVAKAVAQCMAIVFSVIFLFKVQYLSRFFLALLGLLAWGTLTVEKVAIKLAFNRIRAKGYNARTLLIVGTGSHARRLIRTLEAHSDWGYKILGCLEVPNEDLGDGSGARALGSPTAVAVGNTNGGKGVLGGGCDKRVERIPILGTADSLGEILPRTAVDEVAFALPFPLNEGLLPLLDLCAHEGVRTRIMADLATSPFTSTRIEEVDGIPMITFASAPPHLWQLVLKQVLDTVGSFLLLILFSPLMLVISVAIRLTSSGPILFVQERIGLNKRRFKLYKFRTMVEGAEQLQPSLLHLNEMDGPVFKIREDPRTTRVGRLLRRTSLDELPQLWNVLRGEMSFIGPRPPLANEVERYERWQRRRLSMKPGISGLWQVSGRNEVNFDRWMRLDLEYIDNWSLKLDLKILLRTFPTILTGQGAS